jgi:hypothetical protein
MKKLSRRSICSGRAPTLVCAGHAGYRKLLYARRGGDRGISSPCSGSKFSLFFPANSRVSPCSISGRQLVVSH